MRIRVLADESWRVVVDCRTTNCDIRFMTDHEIVRKLKKLYAAEDYFPGVLGNPVTFAARWGLPLSKDYLRSLQSGLNASAGKHTFKKARPLRKRKASAR
jgi:hypothetical protein